MTAVSRNDPIRRTVLYSGKVQGVGFRYTACSVARRYAVTGYVRNLEGGRVELVAEGDLDEVERFLAGVADDLAFCINDTQEWTVTGTGEFRHFDIRY